MVFYNYTIFGILSYYFQFKMPRRKLNIGRSQNDAKRMRVVRKERQLIND